MGSNIHPRRESLRRAIRALRLLHEGGAHEFRVASLYETEPVDCAPGSAPFLNSAIEMRTRLEPEALLTSLRSIEVNEGRPESRARNTPRTLDLDLLYLGEEVRQSPTLTLPHPRLHVRAFVLVPLAEIAPQRRLSGQSLTIGELAAGVEHAGVMKVAWA
jgi:2-amino-4-hydroxy-6-hydroxymethyldihydropteridine diphosphokinase